MIDIPRGWRQGQTLFNFLWWLQSEKGYQPELGSHGCRMADPFHIPDDRFEMLFEEYLEQLNVEDED